MKKVFLFRNVALNGVKVSHALAVGLPSLTAVTGLAGAFAAELARALGLPAASLSNAGVLLAIDSYQLHEGYKKITDKDGSKTSSRALASAFASFTAHFIFEVEGLTPAADEALANQDLVDTSRDVLRGLRLCGASLLGVNRPAAINPEKVQELGGERYAALAALPSASRVLVSAQDVVTRMRAEKLPLMEGLIAATLNPQHRPAPFKAFFETWLSEQVDAELSADFAHKYGIVHDGYLTLGLAAGHTANRPDFDGNLLPVLVASPTLSLVRLQTAASLRNNEARFEDGGRLADLAFWKTFATEGGFSCQPSL